MATEEYSSSNHEFWFSFFKFLCTIPVFMFIGFTITYFIGTFRPTYIKHYNKEALKWTNGGLAEFSGHVFNMTNSSGQETFVEIKQTPSSFYPMYDKCNKKGDPKEGCLHTELRYYDEDILWMKHENHHIIYDPTGKKILENVLDGSLNYTRSPKELGCLKHPNICQERCDEMDGTWNPESRVCNIQIYADNICYRLVKKGDNWELDTANIEKLPQNKEFSMYASDGLGCDYGNNWNSVHYGKTRVSHIRIQLRSSKDSYIAASAYTRSCSNDAPIELNCFGPTHYQERYWCIQWIFVSLAIMGGFILIIVLLYIISRVKYYKAVNQDNNVNEDLLTPTV